MNRPLLASAWHQPNATSSKVRAPLRPRQRMHWLVVLFFLVMVTPATLAFYAGSLYITPYRVIAMLSFPLVAVNLLNGKTKLALPDTLFIAFALWTSITISLNFPSDQKIDRVGQFLLETLGAYFIARTGIRSTADFARLPRIGLAIAAFCLLFAIPESMFRRYFVQEAFALVTGVPALEVRPLDFRLGMLRAATFFEHPILFGTFCAFWLSFVWYTSHRILTRLSRSLLILLPTFFSLSSAPLLLFNAQAVTIFVEFISRGFRGRGIFIGIMVVIAIAALEFGTEGGTIGFIVNYLTFNQTSSYNRILIWDYGWQNIFLSPITGLEPETWFRAPWMKVSIDNYFIYSTMLGGIPSLILQLSAIASIYVLLARTKVDHLARSYGELRRSWMFAMTCLLLSGFSVMFFGKLQPLLFFMLGAGVSAAQAFARDSARGAAILRQLGKQRAVPAAPASMHS